MEFLIPDWPAPPSVRAAVSLRGGGVSAGPYASLNLGDHVGDEPAAVTKNRSRVRLSLGLPAEPFWLQQVHGRQVVHVFPPSQKGGRKSPAQADAAWTDAPGVVCAILSADCLPVLLCDDSGCVAAAAHAGWRGLAAGVLEQTVRALPVLPQSLMAWLGPAIGPSAFEVGAEVREQFIVAHPQADAAFRPRRTSGKWGADLGHLARQRLVQAGVTRIFGGNHCTYSDSTRFFSYRREGVCGRMASLIWIQT